MNTAGTEPSLAANRASWARAEVAWPLALLAGFGATWAGLATGVPSVAPILAMLCLAPIHLTLVRLGRPVAAALLGLGGLAGAAGVVVGAVLEGAAEELLPVLPLASILGREIPVLVHGEPGWQAGQAGLLRAAVFVVALAGARVSRGLVPLVVAFAAVGATAWGVGRVAAPAVAAGANPIASVLLAWPPQGAAELAALLLCGAALAGGAQDGRERRRSLLVGGLGLELAALLAWVLAAESWGRWAAHALGLPAGTG